MSFNQIKHAVMMKRKTFFSKVAAKRILNNSKCMKTFLTGMEIKVVSSTSLKTTMIVLKTRLIAKLALKLKNKARENYKMCLHSKDLKAITCKN